MKTPRRSQSSGSLPELSSSPRSSHSSSFCSSASWIHLRSLLIIVSSTSSITPASKSQRDFPKSPWCRGKEKHALSRRFWTSSFSQDGTLRDGGVKFLKKVRSSGVDPSIRAEVWPFLLGVYNLNSSESERKIAKKKKRKVYEKLRGQCRQLLKPIYESPVYDEDPESPEYCTQNSPLIWVENILEKCIVEEEEHGSESSESCCSDDDELRNLDDSIDNDPKFHRAAAAASVVQGDLSRNIQMEEDFATWQRIIRKDAVRNNAEWVVYSPSQATVSSEKATEAADDVGLADHVGMEPFMVYHAARLVAILEAYALYDPEIGYCQGMSDLLSPILAVMEDDYEAFWCFVGLMRRARHNFRLDEEGIRRQLGVVSRIIKHKDSNLYRHLEKLRAEDCFFVYRMVVVMFRRELSFEQTLCLWEVMWADQAAVRAGVGRKSVWGRIRLRAPPTDDLLLFAIAACVLQRRRRIMKEYSNVDEIMRECNSVAGRLDVWRLLDDAHGLVVALHDKVYI